LAINTLPAGNKLGNGSGLGDRFDGGIHADSSLHSELSFADMLSPCIAGVGSDCRLQWPSSQVGNMKNDGLPYPENRPDRGNVVMG